jgi:hypothetical protein
MSLDNFFRSQSSAAVDIKIHSAVMGAVKALVDQYQDNFKRYQALQSKAKFLEDRFKELSTISKSQTTRSVSPTGPSVNYDTTLIDQTKQRILTDIANLQRNMALQPVQTVETGSILLDGLYNLFSIDKKIAMKLRTATPAQKLDYIFDLPVFAEILSYRDSNEVVEQVVTVPIRVPIKIVERVVERPHHVVVEKVVERPPQVVMMDRVVEKPVTEVQHASSVRMASPQRSSYGPVPVEYQSQPRTQDAPKAPLGLDLDNLSQSRDGAKVVQVRPNTPAAKGGVQPGDVITSVNGKPVATQADFGAAYGAVRPGQTVAFGIRRGTANTTVNVSV